MWAALAAGVAGLIYALVARRSRNVAREGWGAAKAREAGYLERIESLEFENDRLRSPLETDAERRASARAELERRGVSDAAGAT